MISYYGYTISPNQIETGEGFLICKNVPIARTGEQDYLGTEIGLNREDIVKVMRSPEEVFSPAAMASFEGKPVTNDHPPVLLDPQTVGSYEKGHVQNVRKGQGEWEGFIVADLHIHDAELIDAIKNGKRQVSCGYECEYMDNNDGTYSQANIRGNHVAVVENARAGSKAAIMDSNTITPTEAERNKMKKSSFLKLFGAAANGKSAEELNKLAMDAADALEEIGEKTEEKVEEQIQDACGKDACGSKDADPIAELSAKIDKLIEVLMKKPEEEVKEKVEEKTEEKSELDEAIEKIEGKEEIEEKQTDAGEASVVPAEEMDEAEKAIDSAIQAHILKSVRPAVAGIADEKSRKAVSDAIIAAVAVKSNDIKKVMDASASHAAKVQAMNIEAIQNAYSAMNPHNKKEVK